LIRFYLLGQIRLVGPDDRQYRRVLAGDLRLALLTYLALALPGTRRRDTILAMFWPEVSGDEARHRLRQLLYVLRNEFGEGVFLTGNREEIGLNPEAFWCDVVAFRGTIRYGQYQNALHLYGGPLCEGLFIKDSPGFERWLEETRDKLHETATESAWRLAEGYADRGELREACDWGGQALRLDPDEERLRWVLGLYERRGDRVRALRLFERFERMLAQEFELQPSPETIDVVDRIRAHAAGTHPVRDTRPTSWTAEKRVVG
jgi:DNA-binding SARP family transcriptional activator